MNTSNPLLEIIGNERRFLPCVVYRKEPDDKKLTKIPQWFDGTTFVATNWQNPDHWYIALEAIKLAATSKRIINTLSVQLSGPDHDITGIDLDECVTDGPILSERAKQIVQQLASYTTHSVSGSGLHIWIVDRTHLIPEKYAETDHVGIYRHSKHLAEKFESLGAEKAVRVITDPAEAREICRILGVKPIDEVTVAPPVKPFANTNGVTQPTTLGDKAYWAAGLLKRLSPTRCDDYSEWIYVGMCLSELGDTGLKMWDDWSKASSKYEPGACEKKWATFKPGQGLTLGSLHKAANDDDPGGAVEHKYGTGDKVDLNRAPDEATTTRDQALNLTIHPISDDQPTTEHAVKDYGHATVLASYFQRRFRWAFHMGKWREWLGVVWQDVIEEHVVLVASDLLRAKYLLQLQAARTKDTVEQATRNYTDACTYARVLAAMSFLRGWDGILTKPEEWDANAWDLNVLNGIVNLHTGNLKPHDPSAMCTKLAPILYDSAAMGGPWQQHLDRFLPNPAVQRQVQREIGLALVGATLVESLSIWYGKGANGKTTTSRSVLKALGNYAMRAAPNLLIQSDHERHPTELADLAGVRVVFSIEIDQGKQLAEALVKDLTGGDRKKARFMRQDFFEFEQTFSITLIVNHRPIISGTDTGIWRRIRIIPWTQTISASERRPQDDVVTELVADGSAMLNWMLAGLRDWQTDQQWVAPEVLAETETYRAEQDVLNAFYADCCELGLRYTTAVGDLFQTYSKWATDAGEEALSKVKFGALLRQRGMSQSREAHTRGRRWVGIRLRGTSGDKIPGNSLVSENKPSTGKSVPLCPPGDEQQWANNNSTVPAGDLWDGEL